MAVTADFSPPEIFETYDDLAINQELGWTQDELESMPVPAAEPGFSDAATTAGQAVAAPEPLPAQPAPASALESLFEEPPMEQFDTQPINTLLGWSAADLDAPLPPPSYPPDDGSPSTMLSGEDQNDWEPLVNYDTSAINTALGWSAEELAASVVETPAAEPPPPEAAPAPMPTPEVPAEAVADAADAAENTADVTLEMSLQAAEDAAPLSEKPQEPPVEEPATPEPVVAPPEEPAAPEPMAAPPEEPAVPEPVVVPPSAPIPPVESAPAPAKAPVPDLNLDAINALLSQEINQRLSKQAPPKPTATAPIATAAKPEKPAAPARPAPKAEAPKPAPAPKPAILEEPDEDEIGLLSNSGPTAEAAPRTPKAAPDSEKQRSSRKAAKEEPFDLDAIMKMVSEESAKREIGQPSKLEAKPDEATPGA